ncbi:MAG: tryptophan--tRNA ligase [Nitriliruptoraceae bacterium]
MTRVFSGIQPSGVLHLGNYLGALVNWVDMQDRADCVYCVVDLHAMTAPADHDPDTLRRRTIELATGILAVGVDPDRALLFVQSHVHEHAECAWLFNCVATYGELARMPQFKEKSAGHDRSVSAGLLTYPVLQAADILLYHADEVPVGEDQRHHIELARDLAQRFNHRFGQDVFTLPKAVHPRAAARVMDLQEPTNRMSKSATSERGIVYLLDEPARIAKKVKSAVTDSAADIRFDREAKPGVSNLLEIMSAATGRDIDELAAEYDGRGYGTFKSAVAEAIVELLRPVQARHAELVADPGEVERILGRGAETARQTAAATLADAKDAMGLLPASRS